MKHVLLIRHGEVASGHEKRYIGWTDVPLSVAGRAECARLAGKYRADRIYTSPLQRARESAALIFPGREAEFLADERLKERHFGDYEDLLFEEIVQRSSSEWIHAWAEEPESFTFPNGESYADLATRVDAFMAELPEDGVSAVVTHGGVLMHVLGELQHVSPARRRALQPPRGSVTEAEIP